LKGKSKAKAAEAKKVEAAKKRADEAARKGKSRAKEQNNNGKMSSTEAARAPSGVPPPSPASYQWTKEELAEEELSLSDPAQRLAIKKLY
jgi:hypothetical protein